MPCPSTHNRKGRCRNPRPPVRDLSPAQGQGSRPGAGSRVWGCRVEDQTRPTCASLSASANTLKNKDGEKEGKGERNRRIEVWRSGHLAFTCYARRVWASRERSGRFQSPHTGRGITCVPWRCAVTAAAAQPPGWRRTRRGSGCHPAPPRRRRA